ncbi:MAG: alpha/beta fold hydrolase [Bacillota bacterium]
MEHKDVLVQIGAYSLFCRQWGTEGPVVVLIHGIPTHSYLWHHVTADLSRNCRVIAVDLLGYGNSSPAPAEELTLPRQAAHILALLDRLGIAQAHFVGHDLGGGIVQILAIHHPERVLSLAITDGVCFSNWPVPQVVAMRRPFAPAFEPSPARVEEFLRLGTFNQELLTPELLRAFTAPMEPPAGPGRLHQAVLALEHHQTEELVPLLAGIAAPTTILWGQYDRLLPAYWGWRLHEAIKGSHFAVIPEAGHFTMLDQPARLTQELQQHLQRAGAGAGILAQVIDQAIPGLQNPHA